MRESMEVHEAWAAEHLLDLGAPISLSKHPHELDLAVGPGGEVRVPALRRERLQAFTHAIKQRLPEPGPGSDDRGAAVSARCPRLQDADLVGREYLDTVGHRLQVVE